jgi:hypothetical protein
MSDYAQITDFSTKDALTTGDPEKLILGSDVDDELAAISVAIATKYDSGDIASQAQAEAETSNVVLVTPLRLANWADYNAGIVGDLQALADPGADTLLGWDESANATIAFTLISGELLTTTTTIGVGSNIPKLNAANVFTANQTISKATPVFDLTSTSVTNSQFRMWTNSSHKAGLVVPSGSSAYLTGDALGDLDIYAVSGSINLSGNNGTIHASISSAGVLTTPNASAAEVGYKGVPQVTDADNYTFVLTDAGKHVLYTGSGGHTFTIPANASVAFPVGTVLTFVTTSAGGVTIAITSDTLTFAGAGTTGSRTLAAASIATAIKISSTSWLISGAGLS